MIKRKGHKVIITKGPDKGAVGTILDVEGGCVYVQKEAGNFKEMYDTDNKYGFDEKVIKVTTPRLLSKDIVTLLTVAHDGTKLPDEYKGIGKVTVSKSKDDMFLFNFKGKQVELDNKFTELIESAKKIKRKGIQCKIDDIVVFRRGSGSYIGIISDKYGSVYEVMDKRGEHYGIKKGDIVKKFTLKEMYATIKPVKVNKKDDGEIARIKHNMKMLHQIKTSTRTDEAYYIENVKKEMRKARDRVLKVTVDPKVELRYKGMSYTCNKSHIKTPAGIKRCFWSMLKSDKTKVEPISYDCLYGVSISKLNGVHTKTGQYREVNKALKSRNLIRSEKKPFTNKKHIGIEIEMFCNLEREDLNDKLTDAGLGRNVSLISDNSIRPDMGMHPIEVRILASEANIHNVIERAIKVITEAGGKVNYSCGLHVHLDMRHRNVAKSFKNLYSAQDMLFKVVTKERATNQYCKKITTGNFSRAEAIAKHYDAISATAFKKLKTLEVRMHESSLDGTKISNWVNILIAIVENKSIKKTYIPDDFVNQLKLASDADKEYFKTRLTA